MLKKLSSFILLGVAACAHPIPTQLADHCLTVTPEDYDAAALREVYSYPNQVTFACHSPAKSLLWCNKGGGLTVSEAISRAKVVNQQMGCTTAYQFSINGRLTDWARANFSRGPSAAEMFSPIVGGMVAAAGGDPTPFINYGAESGDGGGRLTDTFRAQENCFVYANNNDLAGFQSCQMRNANLAIESIANANRMASSIDNSGGVSACRPASDACELVQSRGEEYVARVQAGQVAGIVDATSKAYCANAVGLEAYNFCASEYRREGREVCANKATAQADAMRVQMSSLAQAASDASINNARNACDFELH